MKLKCKDCGDVITDDVYQECSCKTLWAAPTKRFGTHRKGKGYSILLDSAE